MVLYSLRDFIQPVFSHSCVFCKLPVEIPICESVAPNMHRACSRQIIIPGMDALVLQLHEEGIPSKLSGGRSETVPMALTIPKTRNKSNVCHMPNLHTLCFNMTIPSNAPPCVSNDPPLTRLHITCALCCCIFALILLVLGWKECLVRVLNPTLVDAPCGECIISYQLGRYFLSEISLFCLFKLMGVVPQGW